MSEQTMLEWIFKPNSLLDRIVRIGFGGFLAALVVKTVIDTLAPTPYPQAILSFLVAAGLGIPTLVPSLQPRDQGLLWSTRFIAIGFAWIGALYIIGPLVQHRLHSTPFAYFDILTEAVGTAFFALSWVFLASHEKDKEVQLVDKFAFVILMLLLLVFSAIKVPFEAAVLLGQAGPDDTQSYQYARTLINFLNGMVVLALFIQMRRLLPPPDPVSNLFILGFACAQVAAHARDCLALSTCSNLDIPRVAALVIAWALFLGKAFLGLYFSYVYFNAKIRDTTAGSEELS
jgi:hypothetical protein